MNMLGIPLFTLKWKEMHRKESSISWHFTQCFRRVFLFPVSGPAPRTHFYQPWPSICLYLPWHQFVITNFSPQFILASPGSQFVYTNPGTHYLLAISFIVKTWYSIKASTSMHYLLLPIWVRETLTWYKLGKTTCFFIPKFYTCTVLWLSQSSLHIFYKQPFYKLLDWECWIIKELSGLIL